MSSSSDSLRSATLEILESLDPIEAYVLKRRFGIGEREASEFELVDELFEHVGALRSEGELLDFVRETEARGLRKLREPNRSSRLRDLFRRTRASEISDLHIPTELADVVERVAKLTPQLVQHVRKDPQALNKLAPDVFEHLVGELLAGQGFSEVKLVGRNPYTAADILVTHHVSALGIAHRYFVEVKHSRDRVGVQVVDRVYGAMLSERNSWGWHAALIVSLVGFSKFRKVTREELALRGVELRERDDLLDWLRSYRPNKHGLWLPSD